MQKITIRPTDAPQQAKELSDLGALWITYCDISGIEPKRINPRPGVCIGWCVDSEEYDCLVFRLVDRDGKRRNRAIRLANIMSVTVGGAE